MAAREGIQPIFMHKMIKAKKCLNWNQPNSMNVMGKCDEHTVHTASVVRFTINIHAKALFSAGEKKKPAKCHECDSEGLQHFRHPH